MQITRLNVRIQIQEAVSVQDAIGNWCDDWQVLYGCYAAVDSRGQSGGEVQVAGMTIDHSDLIFTLRYSPRLKDLTTTRHRLIFEGDIYDIQRIDWMNYNNQTIKLYAKKVVR